MTALRLYVRANRARAVLAASAVFVAAWSAGWLLNGWLST